VGLADHRCAAGPVDPPYNSISVHSDRPGHIEITVAATDAQRLVIAESFHHGWQAFVDGEPTSVSSTDDGLLAVDVAAGEHDVELRFRPWSLRLGWFNTLLGLGLTGLMFVAAVGGPRRPTREVDE
jgi:uncharacterized membrane protein YfhO